ncbi:MAG TPA: hypothetical protein P5044_00700 [bacterium]|nr:hypothetical protein [bacterium]
MKITYFLMLFAVLFFSGCHENKNKESDEDSVKMDNDANEIDDKDFPDAENNENDTPDLDSDNEKNCCKYYNTAIASNDSGDIYIAGFTMDNNYGCGCDYHGYYKYPDNDGWKTVYICDEPGGECSFSNHGVLMSDSGKAMVVGFSAPVLINKDHWEWTAQGELTNDAAVVAVWGTSLKDIFAVGVDDYPRVGAIFYFDGSEWMKMGITSKNKLNGVWGTASDNVYAVGKNGTVIHYDGVEWKLMESGTDKSLNSIWGMDKNNIYACGENVIVNFNGTEWKQVLKDNDSFLLGIDGTGSDNIFAVGRTTDIENPEAVIYHFDGSVWKKIETEIKNTLFDVLAMEDGSFFVVGVDTIERITL